jgi:hypothetical protein
MTRIRLFGLQKPDRCIRFILTNIRKPDLSDPDIVMYG